MHAIIGLKIADMLPIVEKSSFLLGCIAPDGVFTVDEKNKSHFFVGDTRDFTRRVDFPTFLQKYSHVMEQHPSYIWGYYAHLIADDIWLKGFNQAWLKNRMKADPNLYEIYHQDFRALNGKLLEHYQCKKELQAIFQSATPIVDLEEIKATDVERLIPHVLEDMEYDKDSLNKQLNVFTFIQIIGYIETSVDMSVLKLQSLIKNK